MQVLGLAGWSGAGKTTLIAILLPELVARGWQVSTVKHTHHDVDLDRPGKDSYRHRQAGATEVMVAGADRWALMREHPGQEPPLAELIARMAPVDLVLVEGFKSSPIAKIEVFRPSLGLPRLWPGRADIAAVASDAALPDCDRTVLPLGDAGAVADWVARFLAAANGGANRRLSL